MARLKCWKETLEYADRWRNECLLKDGSLFEPGKKLWTKKNFMEIKRYFLERPCEGGMPFFEKLELQLSGKAFDNVKGKMCPDIGPSAPEIKKLMAEIYCIAFLLTIKERISVEKKVENIRKIWALSDDNSFDADKFGLTGEVLKGVGSTGPMTNTWRIVKNFVSFFVSCKVKEGEEYHVHLLEKSTKENAWKFASMIEKEEPLKKGQRHILLFLLFPEYFEPIFSDGHKESLYKHLFGDDKENKNNWLGIDKKLYERRKKIEEQHPDRDMNFYDDAILSKNEDGNIWDKCKNELESNEPEVKYKDKSNSSPPDNQRIPFNRIYYGPPGTGKTYTMRGLIEGKKYDKGNYEFVTFHQSYGYEEFIEGLRPKLGDGGDGQVLYEIRSGVFKELCERADENSDQRFALFIDEINRGNVSKIFGELITLIEPDKRAGAKHELSVTLPYSGDKFSVPQNIDIIGTMNTADRSLALLDTALRRRFEFEPLYPDTRDEGEEAPLAGVRVIHKRNNEGKEINIPEMLTEINRRIEELYDREHLIGHAYFMSLKDKSDQFEKLQQIFERNVLPLLEEYFFEDWGKIRTVLDYEKDRDDLCFIKEKKGSGIVEGNEERTCYEINKEALKNPDAYIAIYKKPNNEHS